MTKEILNKPNELISIISKKSITTTQKKAYNSFLKFAQNKLKFEKHETNVFYIPCSVLHENSNINNKNFLYIYEQELKSLMTTTVEIREKDNPKNWKAFTLLSYIEKKDDYYKYELNNYIIKSLKEQTFFTTLNLFIINSLKSQYSIIFYELAIRYEKFKIPKMTIEEVRKLTNTSDQYMRVEAFRRRVLDAACLEITEKTDIKLEYDIKKDGRKISHIDFKITKKNEFSFDSYLEYTDTEMTDEQFKDFQYSEKIMKLYEMLPEKEKINIRYQELEKLLEKYSFELLESDINYCKKMKPKDFWAYFNTSLSSGHFSKAEIEKKQKLEEKKKINEIIEIEEKKLLIENLENRKKMIEEKKKNLSSDEMKEFEFEYSRAQTYAKNIKREDCLNIFVAEIVEKNMVK